MILKVVTRQDRLVAFYHFNHEEVEARWISQTGGKLGWLCDQPMNILRGFVLTIIIDTDPKRRDFVNAMLDDKLFVTNDDGSWEIQDKIDVTSLGLELPDVEVPSWFNLSQAEDIPDDGEIYGSFKAS